MKELGELIALSAQFLEKNNISYPRREAEYLLSRALNLSRVELYMNFSRPCTEEELAYFRALLKRRSLGEPLSYIFGDVEFFGALIEVSPDVLIPRNETEVMVASLAKKLEKEQVKELVCLDLCCGSGCIGIALKKKFPHFTVYASDLSVKALEVAKKNAEKNGVEIHFLQGDLLEPFKGKKADLILCNPPYISEGEFASLEREVRDFEPKMALVSGVSGLEFYQRLSFELPLVLKSNGKVLFEIGCTQGEQLQSLYIDPIWKEKRVEKDYAGHDRFFFLEIE